MPHPSLPVFFIEFRVVISFSPLPVRCHWIFILCNILWDLLVMKDNTDKWPRLTQAAEFLPSCFLFVTFLSSVWMKLTLCALRLTAWPPELQEGMDVQTGREWRGKAQGSWMSCSLHPSFLMRKVECKAIVAHCALYRSNRFVAWGSTGVSSLRMICSSEWASHFTHRALFLCRLIRGLAASLWCWPGFNNSVFSVAVSGTVIVVFWWLPYLNLRGADLSSALD